VVNMGRARCVVAGRATHLVAAVLPAPCNLLPGGYQSGIFKDAKPYLMWKPCQT
jgi:hypothetical protein